MPCIGGYEEQYARKMPLSTVFVSTVGNRPRLWSSQTNIRARDKDVPYYIARMNSTEEIATYQNVQEFRHASPAIAKRSTITTAAGYNYDLPEKNGKKEKKWSLGSLFRRKKKDETESSSEDEQQQQQQQQQQKKGFLGRRRRKSDDKKRKPKTVGGFDHIVLSKTRQAYNGYNRHEDTGILSDPSGGFSNYLGRSMPAPSQTVASQPQSASTSFTNLNHSSIGSGDSISKKRGKELVKARAAARRVTLGNETSSDEEEEDSSLRSNSSLRIRSDESLTKQEVASHSSSRRSRAARTERYLKRHSKDGENPHNYLRLSKSDADDHRSPSRSPLPRFYPPSNDPARNMTGLTTIPPSHGVHGKYRVSNSTSNPSYKPPLSMNEYNNAISKGGNPAGVDKALTAQRSISYDANIHKDPAAVDANEVLHVQFPILRPTTRGYRNFSLIDSSLVNGARQPPQPPPRDPNRTVHAHYFNESAARPNTVHFENNSNTKTNGKAFGAPKPRSGSFNLNPSYKSSSEVHIANERLFQMPSQVRPASTTPEPRSSRFVTRPVQERHTVDGFNYLADKKPRSRKPIFIQTSTKVEPRKDSPTQKALDFWKQIEENVNKSCPKMPAKPTSPPQIFTSQTHVQSHVFLPNDREKPQDTIRTPSPFVPVRAESPKLGDVPKTDPKRKSSNLEEALDELEAIYNSLRLGDENLLDRAEQRENESLAKKAKEINASYGGNRGALSDSSFSYEPFDQVDSPRRRKIVKKGRVPDTKSDDMYNRRLANEKSATISDPQAVLNNVSYLLSSPLQHAYDSDMEVKAITKPNKEPDLTFDDLIYRQVKRANASPRTVEPQPPFGIPLGPVTPAPNSDYLHATPGTICTPPYIRKKIPDIVKDDLAFRNLRKDSNKEPVLPYMSRSDAPTKKVDLNYLKKRRAVRSLSANIGNILGKELRDEEEDEHKSKTLTDIADAMEIARRVLQEKEKNITNTRKAFMSDTEVKPHTNGGDSLKEHRLKFLNSLKNGESGATGRPPKGLTPERNPPANVTTPIPKSAPEESDGSTNSSLDDLLNALAAEAKVTTDRITEELRNLEEKRQNKNGAEELKPCQKLLKAVVDSTRPPSEIVEEIRVSSPPAESANIVQSCFKESSEERKALSDEHDYETIDSDHSDRSKTKGEFEKCQSPFQEKKAELIATFQELKNDIDEIKIPTFVDTKKTDSVYDNLDDATATKASEEGERRFAAAVRCPSNECSNQNNRKNTIRRSLPNNNNNNNNVLNRSRSNSSEHSNGSDDPRLDSLESLKSPKLVLETARRCSIGAVPKGSDRFEPRGCTLDRFDCGAGKTDQAWYQDPANVVFACSYGLACVHHLASIDLVAVLSLLFAVMSFIVALFL